MLDPSADVASLDSSSVVSRPSTPFSSAHTSKWYMKVNFKVMGEVLYIFSQ